jgi:putative N6-adenine-specific DNA methylase
MHHFEFFATTAKGLEDVLAIELNSLGLRRVQPGRGGAAFSGSMVDGYRACLWLRTANRVLLARQDFPCATQDALYAGVYALPWEEHLTPKMTLAVDANLRDSALTHSRYVALKTKDAIVDRIRDRCGARPDVEPKNPDLRINLHLARNHCTVSLDLAGTGMHRRGYRRDPTVAPLKETLAAGLVALSEWDRRAHFVDPMCGSGSLPLEAALLASDTAPGLLSPDFGFQRWPDFDAAAWQDLIAEAEQRRKQLQVNLVFGSDRDRRAVELARRNADRAGLGTGIRWSQHDFARLDPPASQGTLICNPPYGERIGDESKLADFYRKIGDTLKQRWTGWTAWVFTGNRPLAKRIGLKPSRRIVLYNGPIECRLLKFELY